MGRIVEYKGLTFEVWKKSYRLVKPKISPIMDSFTELENESYMYRVLDKMIEIMNLGVEIMNNCKPKWRKKCQ